MDQWPRAGGEMGRRVRAFDWGATDLGPVATWSDGFRQVVEVALCCPLATALVCGPNRRLIYNDAAAALFAGAHPGALGGSLCLWFPDEGTAALCDRAFAGEAVRLAGAAGGLRGAFTPVRDQAGAVTAVLWQAPGPDGQASPARGEEHTARLLAEFQHRVRNILAVVRAIVVRTGETSDDAETFGVHLLGRLDAMARTQAILARPARGGVDLENLVRDELRAQSADERRTTIGGPSVRLSPKAAEVLTLAVHELAVNAIKFGALGAPGGRIEVRWSVEAREDGQPTLAFAWAEQGVRIAVLAPRQEGFGSQLIQRGIPYELNGAAGYRLAPGGLICDISIPLDPCLNAGDQNVER